MYTIGEFSRLCMVTTKTLRHYDAARLLRPAHTSPETGYRYYVAGQFRDMLLIRKLKDYGFSLDEIGQLIRSEPQMLRARMAAKYSEQHDLLHQQRSLLHQMEEDMKRLEKGMDIMSITEKEIKIVETQPTEIMSARDTVAIKDFDVVCNRAFQALGQAGLQPAGPITAIYHSQDFDPESTDLEVGIPVSRKMDGTRTLPGGTCAMAVHLGAYGKLHETYTAVASWLEENGYRITSPPYERYLNSPGEVSEDQLVTEVYFPVAK